uniref:Uncharacterized protein n=1 Tax=viral metagenome TaxID=1070528 RepID=A0A6C0I0B8_9ZZZZ
MSENINGLQEAEPLLKEENGEAEKQILDNNTQKKQKKPIWKWIVGAVLIIIIIIFVVLFAKSASSLAASTTSAASSGMSSVINTATDAVDTGIDAAGIAGGVYGLNWVFGSEIKKFGTDIYNSIHDVIYGTSTASAEIANASETVSTGVDDAETAIKGASDGGAMIEDVAEVAEVAV